MRKSFAFLISSLAAAALMTGCAKQAGVPSQESVDLEAAKKLKMPIVIYNVGVKKDENGMSRPVVYFVNASAKPVNIATYFVKGYTKDGKTVTLWADDYEKVPPGKSSKNGMLGGGWKNADVTCVEIVQAEMHIDGKSQRFSHENIMQLFQDPSINHCQ
jgi:hypothetical protein